MPRTQQPTLLALLAILAFFVLDVSAQGSRESYCSPVNTANNDVYTWPYQSNGNCTNHCGQEGTYAFAVIQYTDCYCSDYIPNNQASISQCGTACPGFPAEHCGNFDAGLWIYLKLTGQPSGTAGANGKPVQPSSSAIVAPRPSSTPQTSQSSVEPQTSIQVVTESGAIVTRTVIQTPSASPNPTSSTAPALTDSGRDSSPNVGAIAGGVAGGVIGLLAIIAGFVFFLWKRRQRQRDAENGGADGAVGAAGITRNTSTMSKAGLLGGATEVGLQHPGLSSNYGSQYSRYGVDNQSTSPTSARRNSRGPQLIVDSRMNPETYIEHAHANASRESVGTIDDSRDYARKLGVRNPDP